MGAKCVVILTGKGDSHSDIVTDRLQSLGEQIIRLNTDQFFDDQVQIEYEQVTKSDRPNVSLWIRGQLLSIENVKSVWCRRPKPVMVSLVTNNDQRQFAERELNEFVLNYYHLLQKTFWVSDLLALERARRKLPQLELASRLGFSVPKTLVTNQPETIKAFFGACKEQMVYKTLHTPNLVVENEFLGVQTSIVTKENLEQVGLISRSGGIFQEYLPKVFEVRVTIIGQEVFSIKIDSQISETGKIDWREALSLGQVSIEPITLPKQVEEGCLKLVHKYGLQFGAIDLVFTTDGEFYFLELNPNGQWYWVEHLTGLPMVASMANLLARSKVS